jgi:hypothetical protein
MASPQARKGSTFERSVATYLRENGHRHCERAYGAGRPADVGDFNGIVGWTLECKNHRSIDLAGWIDEAEAERANGKRGFAAVIAKRRGKATAQSYVVMSLATFARVLAEGDES